ncbi:hypothetical protein M2161_008895 [Streptomyces sp. SAI-133]|jgi:hypothetical protein|nr:hypothetical protein [Streptomyces sp. SAI-133]
MRLQGAYCEQLLGAEGDWCVQKILRVGGRVEYRDCVARTSGIFQ